MKGFWLAALLLLVIPLSSCGKGSSSPATETPDYKKWTLYQEQALYIPLAAPTKVEMGFYGGVHRDYIEDLTNQQSRFVVEFEIFGKVVLRTSADNPRVMQLLTDGKWQNGKAGAKPRIYLLDSEALFKNNEMKGIRIVLETDGGEAETVVVP
jgi:hypothetical protein